MTSSTTTKMVYVSKTADGWLKVSAEGMGNISIPYGLQVKLTEFHDPKEPKSKDGLDHIEILEGVNKGVKATLHRKPGGQSYFESNVALRPRGKIHASVVGMFVDRRVSPCASRSIGSP
jgi:hypothetical protein